MQELCNSLGIDFDEEMIRWGQRPVDFTTEQSQEFEKLWYDTLFSSSRINPPSELSPTLNMFPEFMKDYLKSTNLPIYAELSKKKIIRDNFRHLLNEKELIITVSTFNRERLSAQGLIEDGVALGEKVSVKLKHIDPVYAVTNEPDLIEDKEFVPYRQKYMEEIDIVLNTLTEGDEHLKETKIINKETKFI